MNRTSLLLSILALITSLLPKTCTASAPSGEGQTSSFSVLLEFRMMKDGSSIRVETKGRKISGLDVKKTFAHAAGIGLNDIYRIALNSEPGIISDEKIYDTIELQDKLLHVALKLKPISNDIDPYEKK